ncbi:SDR family NAD(P)-dependent oxidoreductase [Hyphobacterium sp. HN65]|uniref:SDR family NAD(P)-dependent oxidoreductase n=1 Tax=Hyphobacterium lacteum TaxID=3116575 RepID=A0ABU7LQN4_9PROT|nr:SDR family NAD(P)-dependent oxidoreductase [Hyphobacterium sp. HN65]MEE2526219.1 SDR family NAD(P)-dependent oxidoreductase [Hyphobacterium sp. HN65]
MLENLPDNFTAVVFGASGGIGRAITQSLAGDPRCGRVWAGARKPAAGQGKVTPFTFDLQDENSIASAAQDITRQGPVHLVFVATGILHGESFGPERSWRELDPDTMAHIFALNTIGPALIAKHMLEHLPREEPAIFAALSARVGSIGDNRLGGWHSYRASKAALNMLIRNFAIELGRKRKQTICVALHPGTVDTGLSQPFQRNVPDGKLFTPDHSAGKLLDVLSGLTPSDSGFSYAWDGQRIDW